MPSLKRTRLPRGWVLSEIVALLLIAIPGALASPPAAPPALDCLAETGAHRKVTITVLEKSLLLIPPGGAAGEHSIVSRKVLGEGVTARSVIGLADGELSYHDEYGCISRVKLRLRDAGPLSGLACLQRGTPPCPPPGRPTQ